MLPAGHRAWLVWTWVERQELNAMYATIKVRERGVGRSANAPDIRFALWLYATLEGVGGVREISRLVLAHDAARWISNGVQIDDHALSDLRVAHGTALAAVGRVPLQRVGRERRADALPDAGTISCRRCGTLEVRG
jgi:hypothetical protein